jgi:predicted outer membrane repeat protein
VGFGAGGAIYNSKTAIISSSTFKGNKARVCAYGLCGGGKGGAIFNSGTLSVASSTFSGNSVTGPNGPKDGGAIYNYNTGTLSVTNSTFSGNSAGADGGAIFNRGTTAALITNSTFSGNSAADGGAVFGPSSIKSTILAASTGGGENCSAPPPTDIGYNISDDPSCGFTNLDPRLSPAGLTNNGDPTQTIALQVTSPAIDAIPIADCTDQSSPAKKIAIDQRGFPRPDAAASAVSDDANGYSVSVSSCS